MQNLPCSKRSCTEESHGDAKVAWSEFLSILLCLPEQVRMLPCYGHSRAEG